MLHAPTRRRLLQVVSAFFLQLGWAEVVAAASRPTPEQQATLAVFLDTLLPRDSLTGSATDLRVDRQLWLIAGAETRFQRLLELGCQWLNMTGGPPFAQLGEAQRQELVTWMSQSDWGQIPRRFYELVRMAAVELYYSHPDAWRGLPIERPPQPVGYPPPWQ